MSEVTHPKLYVWNTWMLMGNRRNVASLLYVCCIDETR